MSFAPLGAELGAVVQGVDITAITPADAVQLREALAEYLVLGFPGLGPEPEHLETLLAVFGELGRHRFNTPVSPDAPHTMWLDSAETALADVWHSDATFSQCPPSVLGLHMIEGPQVGGDTVWNSLEAAYSSYSRPLRGLFEQLTCIHAQSRDGRVAAEHPFVLRNAITGRQAIFANRQWARRIPQLSEAESENLLGFVHSQNEQLRFGIRWCWSEGDVVVWDNRATLHRVVNDNPSRRRFHRVGVKGHSVATTSQVVADHAAMSDAEGGCTESV